jgi:hypothetical protein
MRLITRVDFDGLVCGAILYELGVIDSWKFVQPSDMQNGLVEVTENDIICNLPYVKGCGMWFDHHSSEMERVDENEEFTGANFQAPSAAHVVYEYFEGRDKLPDMIEMLTAVDKVDSGNLTVEEIINPKGWILLGFVMDPRTGLERFHDRIHSLAVDDVGLIEELMESVRDYDIDELLMLPDVAERVELYWQQIDLYRKMIQKRSDVDGDILVVDMRGYEHIRSGNRFLMYSLFPHQNISIWIEYTNENKDCIFSVGYSVVNRTAVVDVGHLMLEYGGGGHHQVGSCIVSSEKADEVLAEMKNKIQERGKG